MRKRLVHLQTIDVQQRKENFPEPVVWVWLQVDRMTLPDQSLILKQTLSVAQVWGKSWARCEVWTGMCWQEVWRLEDSALFSVCVFKEKEVRAGEDMAVFERKEIKRAVISDIQTVRLRALCILAPHWFSISSVGVHEQEDGENR